jgi:ribosome biogenesis GTPase
MSKRRISKQQAARIEKKQKNYQLTRTTDDPSFQDGLVITRFSRAALIEDNEGKIIHCSIRSGIDSLVAGDRVVWQAENKGHGVVLSCYPRRSVLGRPDKHGHIKAVAANITQLMIVIAAKPEISWPLLDSYLVAADYLGLDDCIVLNKMDLNPTETQSCLEKIYLPLGYALIFTGQDRGNESLEQQLSQQSNVFVGQSGVGKSSLIANILPSQVTLPSAPISLKSELGCHKTSASRLYHLPQGGDIIDSPGVREFGLWHMPIVEIAKSYPEFRPLLSHCKFRDCQHLNAPGCAILQAVSQQLISPLRYENYVKLAGNLNR